MRSILPLKIILTPTSRIQYQKPACTRSRETHFHIFQLLVGTPNLGGQCWWYFNVGLVSLAYEKLRSQHSKCEFPTMGWRFFYWKKWNREWNPVSKEAKLSINIQFQSCLILHLPLVIIHPPYKNNVFQLIWYTKQNQKRIYPITEFWWRRCPYWHENED